MSDQNLVSTNLNRRVVQSVTFYAVLITVTVIIFRNPLSFFKKNVFESSFLQGNVCEDIKEIFIRRHQRKGKSDPEVICRSIYRQFLHNLQSYLYVATA